jgi:hypothetical protein
MLMIAEGQLLGVGRDMRFTAIAIGATLRILGAGIPTAMVSGRLASERIRDEL